MGGPDQAIAEKLAGGWRMRSRRSWGEAKYGAWRSNARR